MTKPEIILIGAGGHAAACIDVIEQQGSFSVAGLVGPAGESVSPVLGYAALGTDEDLPELARRFHFALIAVGQIKSAALRQRLGAQARALGFVLPAIFAPSAYVSPHARVGAGTIVLHGAILNAGVRIGQDCIVNSRALIEHGCEVGDYCHVSTGAILNGAVRLGEGTFVGSRSVIKEQVTIGAGCVIGMGACVRHDLPAQSTFWDHAKADAYHR